MGVGFTPPPPRLELKTKKVIMLLSDVINLNTAFPQLVKSYFEGFFIKKFY